MDNVDRAQAYIDADLAQALANREQSTAPTIIRDGHYVCIDCDTRIPRERVNWLRANGKKPSRCTECQERHELYHEIYTR